MRVIASFGSIAASSLAQVFLAYVLVFFSAFASDSSTASSPVILTGLPANFWFRSKLGLWLIVAFEEFYLRCFRSFPSPIQLEASLTASRPIRLPRQAHDRRQHHRAMNFFAVLPHIHIRRANFQ